jgi:hypothetical protein
MTSRCCRSSTSSTAAAPCSPSTRRLPEWRRLKTLPLLPRLPGNHQPRKFSYVLKVPFSKRRKNHVFSHPENWFAGNAENCDAVYNARMFYPVTVFHKPLSNSLELRLSCWMWIFYLVPIVYSNILNFEIESAYWVSNLEYNFKSTSFM